MSNYTPLSRLQIAQLVAEDIPSGAVVNLGIGIPTMVGEALSPEKEIILHSENGILGMGAVATGDDIDWDLINASREPVRLVPGASISEHTISFAVMRGGHLDYTVLGGFQVAENGDLANWITDAKDAIPAVGGAMDLAVGARHVFVTMSHTTKNGEAKLVQSCTYPLTGSAVVDRIYTDLAIIDVIDSQFVVTAILENLSPKELQDKTGATLHYPKAPKTILRTENAVPYLA